MVGLLHAAAASGGPRGAPVARLAASQWCHLAQPQQGLFSSSEPPRPVVGGGAASSSQSSRAACPPHGGPALCVHPHAECASVQRPCSSRSGALPGPRDSRPHSCKGADMVGRGTGRLPEVQLCAVSASLVSACQGAGRPSPCCERWRHAVWPLRCAAPHLQRVLYPAS